MHYAPNLDRPDQVVRKTAERYSLVVVALTFLVALLFSMAKRGPWYDEFYTYYVTGPDFDLRGGVFQALAGRQSSPSLLHACSRGARMVG